jgi:hypothetical protein
VKVHIEHGDIHRVDLKTRMPFKYGIATMTETPHVFVRLWVLADGKPSVGMAADHLPPKWFTKDPDKPIAVEIDEMLRVIQNALRLAEGLSADSPFDTWLRLEEAQAEWGEQVRLPPLLTQFGTSLVERALIEAVCYAEGRPLHELLRANQFCIRPGDIYYELAGRAPAEFLPERPLERIVVRHTVGLLDPLTDEDIPAGERLDDGLPKSLVACIRSYGLRHFKIKLSGEWERDRDRLEQIAAVMDVYAPSDYAFSLDGNEQFPSLSAFSEYWRNLRLQIALAGFLDHLLFIEQPVHRSTALRFDTEDEVRSLRALAYIDKGEVRSLPLGVLLPPLIIDESDAHSNSLWLALSRGYAGTSHKNCKGIFKSVANYCLLEKLRREEPSRQLVLSGEDLANIGPVALLQDLAVCAALGIQSVERNGHHYFAGLSMFPADMQRRVLKCHGDLYRPSRDGWPTLNIRDGAVDVRSVFAAPFGVGFPVDVEQFELVA